MVPILWGVEGFNLLPWGGSQSSKTVLFVLALMQSAEGGEEGGIDAFGAAVKEIQRAKYIHHTKPKHVSV